MSQRESEIISVALGDALDDADGFQWLVIDMQQVTFMSSMGIGMLVDARSRAAGRKMKVVLSNVATEMDQLLRMVKLEKVFSICLRVRMDSAPRRSSFHSSVFSPGEPSPLWA